MKPTIGLTQAQVNAHRSAIKLFFATYYVLLVCVLDIVAILCPLKYALPAVVLLSVVIILFSRSRARKGDGFLTDLMRASSYDITCKIGIVPFLLLIVAALAPVTVWNYESTWKDDNAASAFMLFVMIVSLVFGMILIKSDAVEKVR